MNNAIMRVEKDVLGEMEVPADAYWGIETQRALLNFQISGRRFPSQFVLALAQVKNACLLANMDLGLIDAEKGEVIEQALAEILVDGRFLDQFPIDVYQTGSGTQTNMNMNEVVANRANEILGYPLGQKYPVHPNDHVNKCQSTNDVFPTSMHLATLQEFQDTLSPAITKLRKSLQQKIEQFKGIIKVGRTHLQDAVPIPLALEFAVYDRQLELAEARIRVMIEELYSIPLGGTAVGTGIDSPKEFAPLAVDYLEQLTGFPFQSNPVKSEAIASHVALCYASSTLRLLALSVIKMAQDIRFMGSGPRAGLGELVLPANEPGSSIMPGKINPTQVEAILQVCSQVIGLDAAISYGESIGSVLELNTCKPLMIVNVIDSIELLASAMNSFVDHC